MQQMHIKVGGKDFHMARTVSYAQGIDLKWESDMHYTINNNFISYTKVFMAHS